MVPDLQTHPDIPAFIKAQAAAVGLHSMVSIPIGAEQRHRRAVGQLGTTTVFTEDESAALAICAEQARCHRKSAFEDSTRRQAWLATILDINKRIAAHEDMASLLAQIAEEAKRLLGADGAILRLLRGDQLVAVGATPHGPTADDAPETRLGEGIAGRAALENRVFMVPDVQAHPDIDPFRKQRAAEAGVNAMLCVPFCGRHQVLGVLSITSTQRRVFTDDEAMVLSAYAEQVAIAIEHARLLAAEEERTAVLERTNLILRDEITERQRIEAERERLLAEQEARNAEMERFTYTVSHDLKSPLITIRGFLGLLEQDVLGGNAERMQTDITYIHMAAATMQRLLDELLELSRIGRVVHPLTEIPLSALAHEAVTLVGGQIAARGVQVHITPDLPVVVGDRPRLLEVLQNLVDNAVKFMGTQPARGLRLDTDRKRKKWSTMCRTTVWELTHGITRRSSVSSNGWSQRATGQGLAWPWSSASSRCMADASGSNPLVRDAGVRSVLLSHNSRAIASRAALRQPGSTNAAAADAERAGDGWLIALEAHGTGLQRREMVQIEQR